MQREPSFQVGSLRVYFLSSVKKESPFSRKKEMRDFASFQGPLTSFALGGRISKGRLRVGEKF